MNSIDRYCMVSSLLLVAVLVVLFTEAGSISDVASEPATVVRAADTGEPDIDRQWAVVVRTETGQEVSVVTTRVAWAKIRPGERVTLVRRASWCGTITTNRLER